MFTAILPKIPQKRTRIMLIILVGIFQLRFIFQPLVSLVIYHDELANLETTFDGEVCMQSTDYTCGPAAAVTALKTFGIDATESELALAADTIPSMGTDDRLLANAIETLYGHQGIKCDVRYFNDIEQIRGNCPIIMVVKYNSSFDHYVTILSIDDKWITVGDPLNGKVSHGHEVFKKEWRRIGIAVQASQTLH